MISAKLLEKKMLHGKLVKDKLVGKDKRLISGMRYESEDGNLPWYI